MSYAPDKRQGYITQLCKLWVKQNAPDVWAAIQDAGYRKYPNPKEPRKMKATISLDVLSETQETAQ